MPVKLRLQRKGRKKRPFYHIVAADGRAPRDGRFIERLGSYNPMTKPATIEIDREKAYEWIVKGAQPTDTVRAILRFKGVYYKKHLMRGVQKGAMTAEEAEAKYQEWIEAKEAKIAARFEQTAQDRQEQLSKLSGTPPPPPAPEPEEEAPAEEAAAETETEAAAEAPAAEKLLLKRQKLPKRQPPQKKRLRKKPPLRKRRLQRKKTKKRRTNKLLGRVFCQAKKVLPAVAKPFLHFNSRLRCALPRFALSLCRFLKRLYFNSIYADLVVH